MTYKLRLLILLFLVTCLQGAALASSKADRIHFLTHDLGNSTYVDELKTLRGLPGGRRSAFFAELVRAMMIEAGEVILVEEVPFVRGLHLIEARSNFALFHLIQTKQRLHQYKWVGPNPKSRSQLRGEPTTAAPNFPSLSSSVTLLDNRHIFSLVDAR